MEHARAEAPALAPGWDEAAAQLRADLRRALGKAKGDAIVAGVDQIVHSFKEAMGREPALWPAKRRAMDRVLLRDFKLLAAKLGSLLGTLESIDDETYNVLLNVWRPGLAEWSMQIERRGMMAGFPQWVREAEGVRDGLVRRTQVLRQRRGRPAHEHRWWLARAVGNLLLTEAIPVRKGARSVFAECVRAAIVAVEGTAPDDVREIIFLTADELRTAVRPAP